MNLNEWDKLEEFIIYNKDNVIESNFYRSILSIKNEKYEEATNCIKKCIDSLEGNLGGLILDCYEKRYDYIIKL